MVGGPNNEDRADMADVALRAFGNAYYHPGSEDDQTILADLVCDLRHLADRLGVDWDNLTEGVESNYRAEIEESPPARRDEGTWT